MMLCINTQLISLILFKIVLFSLLIIFLYDLTKKYITPILWQQIAALEQHWKNLKLQKALVLDTKQHLLEEIATQKIVLDELKVKIKQWHNHTLARRKKGEQKKKAIYTKLAQKKEEQAVYLNVRKTEREILPDALAAARKQLLEHNTKTGKTLTQIITALQKHPLTEKNYERRDQ